MVSACGLSSETEREERVSVSVSVLSISVPARVCLDLRGCVRCAWQWSDG
jgi:hypothetical protein